MEVTSVECVLLCRRRLVSGVLSDEWVDFVSVGLSAGMGLYEAE